MKKILTFILAFAMLVSFVACGDDDNKGTNSTTEKVEQNTVDIVNNAYAATAKALAEAKALGYKGNMIKSVTVDGTTASVRMTLDFDYKDTDGGRVFAVDIVTKSGDASDQVQMYDDTVNLYGNRAGATYLLSDNKDTDAFVENLFKDIEFMDATKITVLSTKIVDTVGNGHGFVMDYDFNDEDFDAEEVIGTDMFSERKAGFPVKVTGLRVSGIVDSEGRLTSQKVEFKYEYTTEVEVPKTDVDPDNSGVTETTEKVVKNVINVISAEFYFDYDLSEVEVPDLIKVLGTEGEGDGEGEDKPVKYDEISISDFQRLSVSTGTEDGK